MDAVAADKPDLTVAQVRDRTGLSRMHIYRLLQRGELGHYRHGGTYRIPECDLAAYLARSYVPSAPCVPGRA